MGGISRAGILTTAGSFIQRGPDNTGQAVLSPDHTKAALVVRSAEGRFQIVVIDVSSGKQLYVQPLSAYSELQGWNNFGIWYAPQSAGNQTVWEPGT